MNSGAYRFVFALLLLLASISGCAINTPLPEITPASPAVQRLLDEAANQFDTGAYDQALATLSMAEEAAASPNDTKRVAGIIVDYAQTLLESRQFTHSREYLQQSLRINLALNNQSGLINDYSNLGKVAAENGRLLDATNAFEQALQLQQRGDDPLAEAVNLNNLANLYSTLGDYERAEQYLNQALAHTRDHKADLLEARTRINLGALLYNLRNYADAVDQLNTALEIATKAKEPKLQALSNTVLGAVYRQQSDFEQALHYYETALAINRKRRHQSDTADSLRILGELYLHRVAGDKKDNLKLANAYLGQARALHEDSRDVLGTAMTISHIGEYHHQRKQYLDAIDAFEESRKRFGTIEFPDGIGRSYINTGFAHAQLGNQDAALADFEAALDAYERLGDREWSRVALFGKAQQLETLGDTTGAIASYKQSIDILESIRSDVAGGQDAQELFTSVNARVYENLVALLASQGDLEGALEYVERSRLRAMRNYMLNTRASSSRSRSGESIDQLGALSKQEEVLERTSRSSDDEATREHATATLAENQQQALKNIRLLNRRYPGFANTLDVIPNTRAIRRDDAFPSDMAIVTYFVTDNSLYIFVARKGQQVVVKSVSISRAALRSRVLDALTLIFNRSGSAQSAVSRGALVLDSDAPETDLHTVLGSLYAFLVEPIENELNEVNTLAVLPFDYLTYLPFETLLASASNAPADYFLQNKRIVYLANQTYTDNFLNLLDGQPRSLVDSVIAFGNPTTGKAEDALPFAQLEVSTIKDYFPDSLVYITEQATKSNFIENWGKHDILHLAAHARLTDAGSEILLAPGDEGVLTMDEMFDLEFNEKTQFIALSACQTGVDPIISGEAATHSTATSDEQILPGVPLASTVHTFSLVGVPSILATLWNIDDQASAVLMSYFYQNLQQGQSYYDALRMAQLSMIGRTDKYNEPYYWAPFVFYGLAR